MREGELSNALALTEWCCLLFLRPCDLRGLCCSVGVRRGEREAAATPDPAVDDSLAATSGQQTAVFAGGCFWGIQLVFEHVKGVVKVTAGYSGGAAKTAAVRGRQQRDNRACRVRARSFTIPLKSRTGSC